MNTPITDCPTCEGEGYILVYTGCARERTCPDCEGTGEATPEQVQNAADYAAEMQEVE